MEQGPQDTPGSHGLCDGKVGMLQRLHTIVRLYNVVMPSVKALDLPGCAGVLSALAADDRLAVMAWMVDDEAVMADVGARATARASPVISTVPLLLAPQCSYRE